MTCFQCGRPQPFHGSERMSGSETGCHDGVLMDDDVHCEGWEDDVIYPPCPYNPLRCQTCGGSGEAPPLMAEALRQDDCADCDGTGWKGGEPQWPVASDEASREG